MSNDFIKPWARWMIKHRLRWVLVLIVVLAFPIYFFSYLPEAIEDFRRDIRSMK